ncbi:MAG: sulfatase-like hydrolase/transferase [Acidobacteriaceae bacterium]
MNLKTFIKAFGAATLVLLLPIWSHLSPHHQALYHSFLPMQSLMRGTLIQLIVLTVLAVLLFRYLENRKGLRGDLLWWLVAAMLAPGLVSSAAVLLHVGLSHLWPELLFYGVLLSALGLCWLRPALCEHGARRIQLLLLLAGCSVFWMVPELFFLAFRSQQRDSPVPVVRTGLSPIRANIPHEGRRIIWLLFDELSYEQTFDRRFPGLLLPNFDRLRSESLTFADLKPAGPDTERVVPSLFLGHEIELLRSDLDGNPSIKLAGQTAWQRFDPKATLFFDAQRLGWTTGLVGWYNPYCRILAGTLDYCFWRMGNGQWDGTSPAKSAWQNATVPLTNELLAWQGKQSFTPQEKHASDLAALMPRAMALIQDQRIGFVFIHLPVPHPPGIYDRRSARISTTGSYIDNLALADRSLGELMDTIQATPRAAETYVVVCSDHSWRVPLWRPTGFWKKEDEDASRGRFDPRPVLMIHSPGQQSEQEVTTLFDELRIHEILEDLLRGVEPPFDKALVAGSHAVIKP